MSEYTITVEADSETVLQFKGYADNITDALYKALAQREEELLEMHKEDLQ